MSDLLLRLLSRLQISVRRRRKISPKARILILNDRQQILLMMHPREKRWRLPGSFVGDDESALEALQRRVQQLTGLGIREAVPIQREQEGDFRPDAMYGDLFQMYATLYLATSWQGMLRSPGTDWELAFFPVDDLPTSSDEEVRRAVDALQAYRKNGYMRVT